jgi:radical SAM family uncharacterized protein/radical SAM-linked protein
MSAQRSTYEALLGRVERPGRYLGNERGMVRKDPADVRLRFALAFPDVYEIAQSHPGLQILYDILNRRPDVFAERVYAPWIDMEAALREAGLPLVSLETATPLATFDVIGFTLQYELTYTNILQMLDLGRVPLRAAERDASHPLVIAGGPCAFNAEPLAEFLDAAVLGDGEEVVHELCDVLLEWDGREREVLLEQLARLRGVYVPAFFVPEYSADGRLLRVRPRRPEYACVEKRVVADLNTVPAPETFIVPSMNIVHDRPSLEVMRGCVKGCRFCQAGYVYRPLRERDPRRVLDHAERVIRQTGHDEVSLLSLSTGDYSCVNPVLTELMNRFASERVAVSLPSTRVDALAPTLLEQIKRVRKTGFTLAPEAGSQRLRDIIQKDYKEADLIEAARQIFALGWRNLKLYFMLGLPGETAADLEGIADLSEKVAASGHFQRQVTASVSNFVPKPHTPFQWAAQLSINETEARQALLRRELAKRRVAFRWHDARLSYLEGILSRGDRRLGALLETAYRLGCRFDGWNNMCRFDLWQQALEHTGLSGAFYLRRRLLDEPLPWDHLSAGISKRYLERELSRAVQGTLTPDCSVERCTYCGACDFETIRNIDYHLSGAKAAEHRGRAVDNWASDIVGVDAELGAWEPRGWQKVHGRPGQAPTGVRTAVTADSPLPPFGGPPTQAGERGLGNAQEWLSAGDEALAPAVPASKRPACLTVRLTYTKLGTARYIGNLELTSLFYRAARRARLPIAFSQGHHPLPRFAFGPALPLGTESVCELVDIDLVESMEPQAVATALNAQLPPGMSVTDAVALPPRTPSISASIAGCHYRIDLRGQCNGTGNAQLQVAIDAFNEAAAFPLVKFAKGGNRTIDARPYVGDLRLDGVGTVAVFVRYDQRGSLKPADLVAAVFQLDPATRGALPICKTATVMHSAAADRTA